MFVIYDTFLENAKKFKKEMNDDFISVEHFLLAFHSDEIRRCIQILSRRTKNNPVIIGEPGVGKTAIAEGLVSFILSIISAIYRDVPMHGWILYEICN